MGQAASRVHRNSVPSTHIRCIIASPHREIWPILLLSPDRSRSGAARRCADRPQWSNPPGLIISFSSLATAILRRSCRHCSARDVKFPSFRPSRPSHPWLQTSYAVRRTTSLILSPCGMRLTVIFQNRPLVRPGQHDKTRTSKRSPSRSTKKPGDRHFDLREGRTSFSEIFGDLSSIGNA